MFLQFRFAVLSKTTFGIAGLFMNIEWSIANRRHCKLSSLNDWNDLLWPLTLLTSTSLYLRCLNWCFYHLDEPFMANEALCWWGDVCFCWWWSFGTSYFQYHWRGQTNALLWRAARFAARKATVRWVYYKLMLAAASCSIGDRRPCGSQCRLGSMLFFFSDIQRSSVG